MKHILILGGAGYIGSALLEEYKEMPNAHITVVDRAFRPHIIKQMRDDWDFIEADISNLGLMKHLIQGQPCDIVHLLAAEVEAETSNERERLIWQQNYELPASIMEICPPSVRLMFPSSANVFGGNKEEVNRIFVDEDLPCPKYPYAETKASMEFLLKEWGGNYTVVRFGTNYGWASGIRFNLVINAFTKRALQGLPLVVHGDGSNYRPFCHTKDCARALIHLSELPEAKGRLYHVVSENHRIIDLANLVRKEIAPVPVEHTALKATFSSYQMDSPALLRTGFQFLRTARAGIREIAYHLHAVSKIGA